MHRVGQLRMRGSIPGILLWVSVEITIFLGIVTLVPLELIQSYLLRNFV